MSEPGPGRVHPAGLPENLRLDRCLVMGVLNVTPDSFSDGGRFSTEGQISGEGQIATEGQISGEGQIATEGQVVTEGRVSVAGGSSSREALPSTSRAVAHGLRLAESGADIVDVGGESTRPGAGRITPAEEIQRVIPVVTGLAAAGVCVSIDTMRAATAHKALEAGATLVNDVSGGLADPEMLPLVSRYEGPFVLMHWRAHSAKMIDRASYRDVVTEVSAEINERVEAAQSAGIDQKRLVIDPGLGFSKEASHNWELLRGLDEFTTTGLPVLVGASRKRFLGALLADTDGPRPVGERESATLAVSTLVAKAGAWCVRVHDVAPSADAVRVVEAWRG